MPIIDPITRDYAEMERKVAACCRDRLKTERFCAEVDRMMKLRAQRRPKEMAQACIDERAKKLLMQNRAGWARDPSQPQQAVLVDKQGCVLTNLDNKPIKPWTGAGVRIPAPNSRDFVHGRLIPHLRKFEGVVSYIYLDTNNNATIGVGHRIKGEKDILAIHSRHVFFKRSDGRPGIEGATFDEVLGDLHRVEETEAGGKGAKYFSQFTTVALHSQSISALLDRISGRTWTTY